MFSCCISCAAIVMRRAQTFAVLSRWQQAIINFLKPNVLLSQHVGPGRSTVQGAPLGSLFQVSDVNVVSERNGHFPLGFL